MLFIVMFCLLLFEQEKFCSDEVKLKVSEELSFFIVEMKK